MGELMDALNELDEREAAEAADGKPRKWALDRAAAAVDKTIEACHEPGMPLYVVSRWTRQAPLHALAIAFLVGVIAARRR